MINDNDIDLPSPLLNRSTNKSYNTHLFFLC